MSPTAKRGWPFSVLSMRIWLFSPPHRLADKLLAWLSRMASGLISARLDVEMYPVMLQGRGYCNIAIWRHTKKRLYSWLNCEGLSYLFRTRPHIRIFVENKSRCFIQMRPFLYRLLVRKISRRRLDIYKGDIS